jgi:hypothetical protein
MHQTSTPSRPKAHRKKFLAPAFLVPIVMGALAFVSCGRKDLVTHPSADGGHFTVKMDPDGRASEIRVFAPDRKPRLRTSIAYDATKGSINEVMIYDGQDELVEGHLMQNGGHAIGPLPPVPNPPFKLSFMATGFVREWKCDGQSLIREERVGQGYRITGPDGVALSTSTRP